jgi:hypothetical protein
MYKKILLILLALTSISTSTFAMNANEAVYSLINSEEFTKLNEPIVFEAESFFENDELKLENVKYEWDFGNKNYDQGSQVVHRYTKTGPYTVTLNTKYENSTTTTIKDIFVSKANILLISDQSNELESITQFKKTAESFDIFTSVISAKNSPSVFVTTELLSQKMPDPRTFQNFQYVIDWTKSGLSKQILQNYIQKNNITLNNSTLVLVNNSQTPLFNNQEKQYLGLENIISIKKPALYTLLESNSYIDFIENLNNQQHEYKIIDSRYGESNILPFTYLVNQLRSKGVNENSLYLLVIIPFLAFTITFAKQVIGLEAIGFYTPLITSLALLNLGLSTGTYIFILLYLFSYIAYKTITRIKLHYLAKNALIVSIFSLLSIIIITFLGVISQTQINIINIAIFPLIVLITVVESFAKQIYLKGYKSGSKRVFETFLVCCITYYLAGGVMKVFNFDISVSIVKNYLLQYPDLNILLILIIFYLGQWKGLKFTEYYNIRKYNSNIEE